MAEWNPTDDELRALVQDTLGDVTIDPTIRDLADLVLREREELMRVRYDSEHAANTISSLATQVHESLLRAEKAEAERDREKRRSEAYADGEAQAHEDRKKAEAERDRLRTSKAVLAERERELLGLKGPCSNRECRLHYAHAGPCDTRAAIAAEEQ